MAQCAECGKESKRKWCSSKCEAKYTRRKNKDRMGKGCPVCGEPTAPQKVYCSVEHSKKAIRKSDIYRDDIIKYHKMGFNQREIAEKIGITRKSVIHYIYGYRRAGVWIDAKPQPPLPPQEAKKVKAAANGVSLYMPEFQRRVLTPEDEKDAKAMAACLSFLGRKDR